MIAILLLHPCLWSRRSWSTSIIWSIRRTLRSSNSNNSNRQRFKLSISTAQIYGDTPRERNMSFVSLSTWRPYSKLAGSIAEISGVYWSTHVNKKAIDSGSYPSFHVLLLEVWMKFLEQDLFEFFYKLNHVMGYRLIKWVVNPAILLRRRFDGMTATSSQIFLFVWKSRVRRG